MDFFAVWCIMILCREEILHLKNSLLNSILNDEEPEEAEKNKGVCQKCGHYMPLVSGRFGVRLCESCNTQMENDSE